MEGCTFYPNLINKSFSNSHREKSCYDKLYESQREKEKKIKILSEEIERKMNKDCTFIPKINKTINTNDKIKGKFLDRVKIYKEASKDKFKKLEEEYSTILKESQRKEQASKRSLSKCPSSNTIERRGDLNDLFKKQKQFLDEKKRKLDKIEENILQEKGITFKPKLNDEKLKDINTSLLERNAAFLEKKSIKIKSAVTLQELECTFAPRINQVYYSEEKDSITAGQRLFEYSKRYSEKKEMIKENFKEEYSFKPQINSNTHSILKNRDNYLELLKKKFDNKFKWKSANNNDNANNSSLKEVDEPDHSLNLNELEQNYKSHDLPLNQTPSKKEEENSKKIIEEAPLIIENKYNINKNKENTKYNDSPLKIERQNLNYPKQDKKNSIPKNSFKNPFYLEKLTDNQLLELANNYITTDESLEMFNKMGKLKKNTTRSEEVKEVSGDQKINENPGISKKAIKKNFTFSGKNEQNLPKNIKDALNHYKIAENI